MPEAQTAVNLSADKDQGQEEESKESSEEVNQQSEEANEEEASEDLRYFSLKPAEAVAKPSEAADAQMEEAESESGKQSGSEEDIEMDLPEIDDE